MGWEKVRYLVARPRKAGPAFYWVPTARLIAAGFEVTRLPDNRTAAVAEAERLNARLDAWYAGEPLDPPRGPAAWTLAALDDLFQTDAEFRGLAPRSQRDYEYCIKPAIAWAGDIRVDQIDRLALMTWLRALAERRSPSTARNAGAALRRLLTFGRDQGWIAVNPATGARLPTPGSRARVWSLLERDTLCATAIGAGNPSMALAVMLGWCIGQRPADLRTLAWSAYDGRTMALRQAKTGADMRIPVLPDLKRLLDAAARTSPIIVVSEETARPYQESAFQHLFARLRLAAALPKDLQFRDLRRTLATALGAAGCTDDQIRAITGHKTRSVVAVYVRPDDTFAKGAMDRLKRAQRVKS